MKTSDLIAIPSAIVPDRVAVSFEGKDYTYEQFADRVNRVILPSGRTYGFTFDPSGNRLETFGGYTAYQMDPDCRAIRWTQDQIGPAVFYYSQELNETFLSVYT